MKMLHGRLKVDVRRYLLFALAEVGSKNSPGHFVSLPARIENEQFITAMIVAEAYGFTNSFLTPDRLILIYAKRLLFGSCTGFLAIC